MRAVPGSRVYDEIYPKLGKPRPSDVRIRRNSSELQSCQSLQLPALVLWWPVNGQINGPRSVLGDDRVAARTRSERVDHVLELGTAAGFRRAEIQSGAVVGDAIVGARLPLDRNSPVLTVALCISVGGAALWQSVGLYLSQQGLPIGSAFQLRLTGGAYP